MQADTPNRLRQAALRERLARERADAAVVAHLPNIRYLTGFTGSNALLALTPRGAWLYTDGRYTQQAAEEVREARVVVPPRGDLWRAASRRCAAAATVALEFDRVSVAQRDRFVRTWGGKPRHLRSAAGWVEMLRAVKDTGEIAALRRAINLASSVFEPLLRRIRPGMLETELAAELEYALRRAGGEGLAFDTIIASGPRGARVHAHPGPQPLVRQGFLVMDYGVILGGYVSDMTRTVHLGKPSRRANSLYRVVLAAQQAAIAVIRPGVRAAAVDAAARAVIRDAGWGSCFPHSTGHGVGLEIHEAPRLARTSTDVLVEGQVITVEPGIYIPGWGGLRIEDVVLVTADGAEVLTPTAKDTLRVL